MCLLQVLSGIPCDMGTGRLRSSLFHVCEAMIATLSARLPSMCRVPPEHSEDSTNAWAETDNGVSCFMQAAGAEL